MNSKIKFGISGAVLAAVIATSVPLFAGQTRVSEKINNLSAATAEEVQKVVRIGYFPNINHAQAVIGLGRGDFQKILNGDDNNRNGNNNNKTTTATNTNPKVTVKPLVFNAGPSAVEALFANRVDIIYVGPNPAINGYIKTEGQGLRIVSGAASGGAVFVVRNDSNIHSSADFAGKKFASPQLGNTQDVSLRKFLLENGYKTRENGGSVEVIPATNADILTLFLKKEIDGAWVPEPWGAKLVKEANGRIFLDERDRWPEGQFVTAHIVVRTDYLKNNPDVIKKVIEANIDETKWINDHPEEALKVYNEELKKLTGKTIPDDEFRSAISRLTLTYDPVKSSLFKAANDAYDIGFLKQKPDLSGEYMT